MAPPAEGKLAQQEKIALRQELKDQRKQVEEAITTLPEQVGARCSQENSVPLTNEVTLGI